jgi:iron complex outermembrane receptor protein
MAPYKPSIALLAALASASGLHAQGVTLKPVVIQERGEPAADVSGFPDVPLRDLPAAVTVIGRQQIEASGARRLADLTSFDPSVGDAYNAPGYWDFLSIRGFTLDNRFNYRREGLPVSAETVIALDNKESVEILKGTSGIQAGTSAPGGLVNYVVKRPQQGDLREQRLEATQRSSLLVAADLGGRIGVDRAIGWRLNLAQERLRPLLRNLDGDRSLLALAADWRVNADSVLQAEFEYSRKTQPSQAGFSLLGPHLPAPADPRLNLNNQPWSQASRFDAFTGTLRFEQALNAQWRWTAQLGTQRLKTDDRLAFPFGCGAEGNFDRFCSDGTYDLYDFRSDNERRNQHAAALGLKGQLRTGPVTHDLSTGVLFGRLRHRFEPQAFNYVGTGNVAGTLMAPEDPAALTVIPDRDERSAEWFLHDAVRWNDRFTTWLGVRHTRLDRGYRQNLTTPWLAASYRFGKVTAYGSWGQGVESQQVPTVAVVPYVNPGEVLPALKSRQLELGVKGEADRLGWQLALFHIRRPMTNIDFCTRTFSECLGRHDGHAVHRGAEASVQWNSGTWEWTGGVALVDAKREGSTAEPTVNGRRPPNVPRSVVRASAGWNVPAVPGLQLRAQLSHEGRRSVLADGSIELPGWTRVDAAAHYQTRMGHTPLRWTVGVDNLLGRRYWRESPFQFGHVYLYPGAPRTVRLSVTASL